MTAPAVFTMSKSRAGFFPSDPLMRRSIQRAHGRPVYVLMERLVYVARNGWTHMIEPGTTTDWNSVPRWATWVVPVDDKAGLCALLHDELLTDRSHGMTRAQLDETFREALLLVGVPAWRAWAMWGAVRLQALWTGDVP